MNIEAWLLAIGIVLVLSIIASKLSSKLGIPVLLFFLAIGMFAGSDGPGGYWFSDAHLAQNIGIVALVFILFAGGMELDWKSAKPFVKQAATLATIGVVVTASIVALATWFWLGYSPLESLLIGSIVASTDAAAVFSTLARGGLQLSNKAKNILEMESGSNDPIAIFLTIVFVSILSNQSVGIPERVALFFWEFGSGAIGGWLIGRVGVVAMRRLRISYEGMFHGMSIAVALISFAGIHLLHGNGFLAVYVAGVTFGNGQFRQRNGLRQFHDGIAWLMQIMLFVVLGLLVFPSQLPTVALSGLIVSGVLMFIARPIGVLLSLSPFRTSLEDQTAIAWCGLKGAVPIVLATYPLVQKLERAQEYFNIVFFVVILSALLQGTTIPFIVNRLNASKNPT
jgi:potassium/hydrogen antiporter